jgi:HEAT repeat protein
VAGEAIRAAALNDPVMDVRREAVFALGDAKKTDFSQALITAYGDREARVRSAAMASMKASARPDLVPTLQHAFELDSSYAVAGGALSALAKIDSLHALTYCAEGLKRNSYREGIRISAIRALANLGSDSAFYLIKNATAYGNDRGVRIEGLWLLSRNWKSRDETFTYMLSVLNDASPNVRRTAAQILGSLGDARAMNALEAIADHDTDTRMVKDARDAMAKIQEKKTPETKK